MDAIKLVTFLGHSSVHEPFDRFLTEMGVTKRPKKIESTVNIALTKEKVDITFEIEETFEERTLVGKRSEGRFILQRVSFNNGFDGPLPHGLELSMDRKEVDALLGVPRAESPVGPSATYYKDGLVIVFNWSKASPADRFVRFALPTVSHRERLGI